MHVLIVSFLLLLCPVHEFAPNIEGTWKIPEEEVEVEIRKENDLYQGVIITADKDELVGKRLLHDLKENSGAYTGKFYAIRKDRLVNVTCIPEGDELTVEISAGLMGKTMKWKRVE